MSAFNNISLEKQLLLSLQESSAAEKLCLEAQIVPKILPQAELLLAPQYQEKLAAVSELRNRINTQENILKDHHQSLEILTAPGKLESSAASLTRETMTFVKLLMKRLRISGQPGDITQAIQDSQDLLDKTTKDTSQEIGLQVIAQEEKLSQLKGKIQTLQCNTPKHHIALPVLEAALVAIKEFKYQLLLLGHTKAINDLLAESDQLLDKAGSVIRIQLKYLLNVQASHVSSLSQMEVRLMKQLVRLTQTDLNMEPARTKHAIQKALRHLETKAYSINTARRSSEESIDWQNFVRDSEGSVSIAIMRQSVDETELNSASSSKDAVWSSDSDEDSSDDDSGRVDSSDDDTPFVFGASCYSER